MFHPVSNLFRITEFYPTVLDRRFPENYKYDGEIHNFWEVVYVIDGKIEVTEDEKVYVLGEKDIIFHAPNEFHSIRSAENTSPRVINVSFRAKGDLPEYLKGGVFHLSSDLHEEYLYVVDMIQTSIEQKKQKEPTDFFEASCRLTAFFMRLKRESHKKDSLSTSQGAKIYSSLIELMHEKIYNNISLEEIAKMRFISVSYVKKLFRHYAGISPKSYYIKLRVAEAQRLLSTDMPISDISEKMNFSSPSYFTLFFKSQTGFTPIQYRKMK